MKNLDLTRAAGEGDEAWEFSDIGPYVGCQLDSGEEARILKFGTALAKLVRKHFGLVTPILDTCTDKSS